MIDSKELRIGNLIYQQTLKVIPANFINKEVVIVGYIDDELFPNDITNQFAGIPLTEEWLLRFGFERHHKDYSNSHIILKNIGVWDLMIYPQGENPQSAIAMNRKIEYVHTLQNLIFAIKGEELKY